MIRDRNWENGLSETHEYFVSDTRSIVRKILTRRFQLHIERHKKKNHNWLGVLFEVNYDLIWWYFKV